MTQRRTVPILLIRRMLKRLDLRGCQSYIWKLDDYAKKWSIK